MQSDVLIQLARMKPLTAWSIGAVLLGTGVSIYNVGLGGVDWILWILAALVAVALQYVAHPLNDIMDYEVDRKGAIAETGRHKPLVDGRATVKEFVSLSGAILVVIFAMVCVLNLHRPMLIIPSLFGIFAVIGYNYFPLKLAYKPFADWYLGAPVNFLMVFCMEYVATGTVSELGFVAGLCHAFIAPAFFTTMMSMDYPNDIKYGKVTTVGINPKLSSCMWFPLVGYFLVTASLVWSLKEALDPAISMVSAMGAIVLLFLAASGRKADNLRRWYLKAVQFGDSFQIAEREGIFVGETGTIRIIQLKVAVLYAVITSLSLTILGVI